MRYICKPFYVNPTTIYNMDTLFAEKLKSARIMNGLSLSELSVKIGNKVSRQALHKYEKGETIPDSETLGLLCNALNVRPDYFTCEVNIDLGAIHFRKLDKLPVKDQKSIVERTRENLSRYIELEEIVGINESFINPLKGFLINRIEDIDKMVDKLRDEWQLYDNPIQNVIELLEDHYIKVIEIEAGDEFDGLQTWIKQNTIPVIVLNTCKLKSKDRKRFSALHELGHLLLPLEGISDNLAEKYCHTFAGALLFPHKAAVSELGKSRSKLSIHELGILKKQYGISIQALVYRAYNLGIVSENYKNYFFRYINEMGWKVEEPFALEGQEIPVRFDQILYRALSEDLLSMSKAASLKNMTFSEFRTKMMTAG